MVFDVEHNAFLVNLNRCILHDTPTRAISLENDGNRMKEGKKKWQNAKDRDSKKICIRMHMKKEWQKKNSVIMCVCVWVSEWEREREREKHRDREMMMMMREREINEDSPLKKIPWQRSFFPRTTRSIWDKIEQQSHYLFFLLSVIHLQSKLWYLEIFSLSD